MKTLNSRCSTFALLALAIAAAATPARAETTNCTPITTVPYTIAVQGVYCFTGNLATAITSGVAITIATSNVTLDMNGFKLGGLGAGPSTQATGIYSYQRQNITIRNGIVRGFQHGIWLDDIAPFTTSQGHLVEDVLADQNTFFGFRVVGRACVVRRNQVVATGGGTLNDARAMEVVGPGNDVLNNRVAGTVGTGETRGIYIFYGTGTVLEGNRVSGDLSGFVAYGLLIESSSGVLVAGNRITMADSGIVFQTSSGKYMDNLTYDVTTPFTGGTAVGTNN